MTCESPASATDASFSRSFSSIGGFWPTEMAAAGMHDSLHTLSMRDVRAQPLRPVPASRDRALRLVASGQVLRLRCSRWLGSSDTASKNSTAVSFGTVFCWVQAAGLLAAALTHDFLHTLSMRDVRAQPLRPVLASSRSCSSAGGFWPSLTFRCSGWLGSSDTASKNSAAVSFRTGLCWLQTFQKFRLQDYWLLHEM